MSKVATVGVVLLLGTGCATGRAPLQAMLLPPVDGKLALWVNQPAYFAVLGVGSERGTEVLYQQTALESVPASGYVYVPIRGEAVAAPELVNPDAQYEQVYLVASPTPIDLSGIPSAARDIDPGARPDFHEGSVRSLLASSAVVDGYEVRDTIDRVVCLNDRSTPFRAYAGYVKESDDPWHVYRIHGMTCPQHLQRSVRTVATTRTFIRPTPRSIPPGKWVPPRRPPGLEPRDIDRTARYLAAKDEWHALTHNGEPGTELAHAGYTQTSAGWSRSTTSVAYATHSSTSAQSNSPTTHVASAAVSSSSSSSSSPSSAATHH